MKVDPETGKKALPTWCAQAHPPRTQPRPGIPRDCSLTSRPRRCARPRGAPLAGSLAGVTSTVTCFPLEVLRTRLAVSTEARAGPRTLLPSHPRRAVRRPRESARSPMPTLTLNLPPHGALSAPFSRSTKACWTRW